MTQRSKKEKQVHTETRTREKGQEQAQAGQQTVSVTMNGPYIVAGSVPLARQIIEQNDLGESWNWREGEQFEQRETYRLCRCGGSANKPFCDGTHLKNGFDGTEVARNEQYAEMAEVIDGPELTLTDAQPLCAFARFCDAQGQVWNLVEQEGNTARSLTMREAGHCPSGRLMTWREREDGKMEPAGEPTFEPSIGVIEDPQQRVSGPLWVRGGIQLVSADGTAYEVRNRMTLCRCGASQNKPFCDGSHASIGFNDGHIEG